MRDIASNHARLPPGAILRNFTQKYALAGFGVLLRKNAYFYVGAFIDAYFTQKITYYYVRIRVVEFAEACSQIEP